MNLILKQILILGTTFFVILWFQNCEDTRNNKVRTTFHDTYKLPVLVTALLGLAESRGSLKLLKSSSQLFKFEYT
jgi:hypothetical protein